MILSHIAVNPCVNSSRKTSFKPSPFLCLPCPQIVALQDSLRKPVIKSEPSARVSPVVLHHTYLSLLLRL